MFCTKHAFHLHGKSVHAEVEYPYRKPAAIFFNTAPTWVHVSPHLKNYIFRLLYY